MAAHRGVQRATGQGPALEMRLSGHPGEQATLRAEVDGLAAAQGLSERSADVVLALEELIANAQEHGAPPVEVTAWGDGRMVIEVTDGGSMRSAPAAPARPPTSDQDRGRGLWIVSQLADHLSVASTTRGTTVRIEFTSEPPIGA
jgi:anti-sigma regulatory factor (Ser/Thr protein kinase)